MQGEIKGTTMPVLEVTLEPGEQVISTHGELSWMTPTIQMSQHTSAGPAGEGSHGHLMQGLKRVLGGGGLFLTHYEAVNGAGTMPLPVLAHSLEPYLGQSGDPQAAEAGAMGGIIGNIMRGQ
jgi:uncharacterized protein (AIM24 family)